MATEKKFTCPFCDSTLMCGTCLANYYDDMAIQAGQEEEKVFIGSGEDAIYGEVTVVGAVAYGKAA